jgi:hypothetical protein
MSTNVDTRQGPVASSLHLARLATDAEPVPRLQEGCSGQSRKSLQQIRFRLMRGPTRIAQEHKAVHLAQCLPIFQGS